MSEEISQRELRNDSGRIMRALDAGRSFVVNSNGRPVGELIPLRRRRFVEAETAIAAMRNGPRVDYRRLREDLDRVADQDVPDRV